MLVIDITCLKLFVIATKVSLASSTYHCFIYTIMDDKLICCTIYINSTTILCQPVNHSVNTNVLVHETRLEIINNIAEQNIYHHSLKT